MKFIYLSFLAQQIFHEAKPLHSHLGSYQQQSLHCLILVSLALWVCVCVQFLQSPLLGYLLKTQLVGFSYLFSDYEALRKLSTFLLGQKQNQITLTHTYTHTENEPETPKSRQFIEKLLLRHLPMPTPHQQQTDNDILSHILYWKWNDTVSLPSVDDELLYATTQVNKSCKTKQAYLCRIFE